MVWPRCLPNTSLGAQLRPVIRQVASRMTRIIAEIAEHNRKLSGQPVSRTLSNDRGESRS